MKAMRSIYLRSLLLVLGCAALLVLEQLAPTPGATGAAPAVAVGGGRTPA